MSKDIYYVGMLAEIRAAGLTEKQVQDICTSMDTTPARVHECLARAEFEAESLKGNIPEGKNIERWLKEEDRGYLDSEGYHLRPEYQHRGDPLNLPITMQESQALISVVGQAQATQEIDKEDRDPVRWVMERLSKLVRETIESRR